MKTAWGIVIVLFLAGCSAQSKLRRAQRLIKLAEAEGAAWKVDTVFSERIVIVSETKVDTVVKVVNWTDTITLTKDKIVTRVVVTPAEKRVYIESKCDPDTIRIKVPTTVNKVIQVDKIGTWDWIKIFLIGFAAGVILFGVYRLLR